ncbi:hypothetical protein H7H78_12430 [Mycobacterium shinjukuense]|nr:hypothetical protein [Mycobacterium shinjukuense]MCV6986210.1 hypothetical protein [Mycobacterium shinjukuense]
MALRVIPEGPTVASARVEASNVRGAGARRGAAMLAAAPAVDPISRGMP